MSEILQLGKHPDADQLSAFAENAVPAHERGEMLAHLADCGDCRQILALSLTPLEAPSTHPAEPESEASLWSGSGWFSGWKLAWLGAPALAALVFLTVHVRDSARDRQRAAAGSAQAAEVRPRSPQKDALSKSEHPAMVTGAIPAAPVAKLRRVRPSEAEPAAEVTAEGRERASAKEAPAVAPSLGGPVALSAGVAGMASGSSASPMQKAEGETQQLLDAAPSAGRSLRSAARSQAAPANASAEVFLPGGAALASKAPVDEPASSLAPAAQPKTQASRFGASAALSKSGIASAPAPLPSGQSILAYAADLNRRVAIDAQHDLFCSEDDGRHWTQVSAPWPGRAITVATISRVGSHAKSFFSAPERFQAGTAVTAKGSVPAAALSSSLSGTVLDPTGAVIPGAEVAIQDARHAVVRTGKSDTTGHYFFANVAPGSYRIDVHSPGFVKQSFAEDVAPSQQATRDVILPVGLATQTVTVDAAKLQQLETRSRSASVPDDAAKKVGLRSSNQFLPIFAITTDQGERWTSIDGRSWKQE